MSWFGKIENKQKISSRLLVHIHQSRSASAHTLHVIYCIRSKNPSKLLETKRWWWWWWWYLRQLNMLGDIRIFVCGACLYVRMETCSNACQFIICQVHFIWNDLLWSTIQHLKWLLNRILYILYYILQVTYTQTRTNTRIHNRQQIANDEKKTV